MKNKRQSRCLTWTTHETQISLLPHHFSRPSRLQGLDRFPGMIRR
jgi:hypothetical protein